MAPLQHMSRHPRIAIGFITYYVSLFMFTGLFEIPVILQMIGYVLPILWSGCQLSLEHRTTEIPEGGVMDGEVLGKGEAARLPFIASLLMLTLYFALKVLPPHILTILVTTQFTCLGWFAVTQSAISLMQLAKGDDDQVIKVINWEKVPILRWFFEGAVRITRMRVGCSFVGVVVAVLWAKTKWWPFHNTIALCFTVQALRVFSVNTFKIGTWLLIGLLIYDVFWVYGTDVMVSVAKGFDAPIKLLFPRIEHREMRAFSLLGLGDIIVPGSFLALTLRFDYMLNQHRATEATASGVEMASSHITAKSSSKKAESTTDRKTDEPKSKRGKKTRKDSEASASKIQLMPFRDFSRFYFHCGFIGYTLALVLTALIMLFFNRAQPALLYLVPAMILFLYVPAWFRGDLTLLHKFNEEKGRPSFLSDESEGEEEEVEN